MPLRPIVFALGILACLAGAITCATAPADAISTFPATSDVLILGGLVLLVIGAAGKAPRGRQLLGRPTASRTASSAPPRSAPPRSAPRDTDGNGAP